MKQNLLMTSMVFLFCIINLNGQKINSQSTEVQPSSHKVAYKDSTYVSRLKFQSNTSLLFSFMQGLGVGKSFIRPLTSNEIFVMATGGIGLFKGLDVGGALYFQNNIFFSDRTLGRFVKMEAGVMANLDRIHAIVVSKSDKETKVEYSPMFSVGLGHSYKIGRDSYFRISFDVGYKSSPVNFNLSIIF